jgi:nitrate reductase alpha subunit
MVIIGAAMNHWYHMDMNYRGIINMLVMCGCVGQSGGGWSHYVGQEKLRPQTGWAPLAFALDWARPPRQQNSTSLLLRAHRPVALRDAALVAKSSRPPRRKGDWDGSLIDYNARAERMGWLPSAPQLKTNPLDPGQGAPPRRARAEGLCGAVSSRPAAGMSCEDPDDPVNWPRNMFVWRSNLLGSSGKGHEYFLKHLLGTTHGVQGKDLGERAGSKPKSR